MTEYNQYVTAVNKIFYNLEKMKTGWNHLDNLNYIDSIEEYKQIVASAAEIFKKEKLLKAEKLDGGNEKNIETLEESSNDRETNIWSNIRNL